MAKKVTEQIVISAFNFGAVRLRVVGTAPLLCNNIEKAMLPNCVDEYGNYTYDDKALRNESRSRSAEEKFQDSTYKQLGADGKPISFQEALEVNKFAFPQQAFKKAMVRMGGKTISAPQTELSSYLFVVPETLESGIKSEFATLDYGKKPPFRRSMAVKDPPECRHRAQFNDWSLQLEIRFPENIFDPSSVVNAMRAAGMFNGVGDYRPEKIKGVGGSFGTFEIDMASIQVFEKNTWTGLAL